MLGEIVTGATEQDALGGALVPRPTDHQIDLRAQGPELDQDRSHDNVDFSARQRPDLFTRGRGHDIGILDHRGGRPPARSAVHMQLDDIQDLESRAYIHGKERCMGQRHLAWV